MAFANTFLRCLQFFHEYADGDSINRPECTALCASEYVGTVCHFIVKNKKCWKDFHRARQAVYQLMLTQNRTEIAQDTTAADISNQDKLSTASW